MQVSLKVLFLNRRGQLKQMHVREVLFFEIVSQLVCFPAPVFSTCPLIWIVFLLKRHLPIGKYVKFIVKTVEVFSIIGVK